METTETLAESEAVEPEHPAAIVAEPPTVADGVERALDPRAVSLSRRVGGVFVAAISSPVFLTFFLLALLAPILTWVKALLLLVWAVLTLAAAWFVFRWPEVNHRHVSYRVDAQGIEIRRGVIWRSVINVPRSRVQHTDVAQGPLERMHGLGTLVIYTAGTAHAKVSLHGLDHGTALRIRDHLLPGDGRDAV